MCLDSETTNRNQHVFFILLLSKYWRWTCSCVFFLFVIKVVWAQWHHLASSSWIWTTLAQVMACCLVSPSHYLTCKSLLGLTHWGRVTHICVSDLTNIGPDNGLSPARRQAIIWTKAGILLNEPLGTNFSEIFIGIQIFLFMKMRLKMSSAKCRPFCLGLNVLNAYLVNNIKSTLVKVQQINLMWVISSKWMQRQNQNVSVNNVYFATLCNKARCSSKQCLSRWTYDIHIKKSHTSTHWRRVMHVSEIILCMGSANETQCYKVPPSLVGWAHTQNDLWYMQLCIILMIVFFKSSDNGLLSVRHQATI